MEEQILAVDLSTEQVLEVNLPEQDNVAQIDVYWQDEVTLDLDLSLMYIVSGQREIQDYVDNKSKPEIDDYIETYAKPIVSEVVEEIAAPVVGDYIENVTKPEIKEFADKEMAGYAATATAQVVLATEQAVIATEKANEASETAKIVDEKVQEFSQTTEASKTEFVNFAQEKTEEFAQTAEQAIADSQANVEKSRIWAEGEQAEVKPLGGELSSMGAADLAYAIANAPEDTPIDASGLFAMNVVKGEKGDKGDKGDAGKDGVDGKSVFDGYATNCITEIPQDIKLELNNGVLTLKAGSKVYFADGTSYVLSADKTRDVSSGTQAVFVYLKNQKRFVDMTVVACFSGATQPNATGYVLWFDTSNNIVKYTTNSFQDWEECSFPVCLCNISDSTITSIDQVFNGCGYIGSTAFTLPGGNGLIPNGRNEDGTLRNIECKREKLNLYNLNKAKNWVTFAGNGEQRWECLPEHYTQSNVMPSVVEENQIWYNIIENQLYYKAWDKTEFEKIYAYEIFNFKSSSETFTPKLPFRAVDYSDSSWVSAQGMPSERYIDLTFGASGTSYTAPANGWFCVYGIVSAGDGVLEVQGKLIAGGQNASATGSIWVSTPVKRGDSVKIVYNAYTNQRFYFRYAEGEN